MGNWGEIPMDIATKIVEHLYCYEDVRVFGRVCTQWRRAKGVADSLAFSRGTPWLMLTDPPCTWKRRFFSLSNHKIVHHELPEPETLRGDRDVEFDSDLNEISHFVENDDIKYLSSNGWLLCITQLEHDFFLVHPITKQVIRPPPPPYKLFMKACHVKKFALSEDPLTTNDYTMVVSEGFHFWVWSSKNDKWTVHNNAHCLIKEITFYKGDFYGVDSEGKVVVVSSNNISIDNYYAFKYPKLVTRLPIGGGWSSSDFVNIYILESAGALLVILHEVKGFKVWEVNAENGEYKEMKNIGNRAVFVGPCSSSIQGFPPHCMPNCIYYTYHFCGCYSSCEGCGNSNVGVFDLTRGCKIEKELPDCPSIFNSPSPPQWISPMGR